MKQALNVLGVEATAIGTALIDQPTRAQMHEELIVGLDKVNEKLAEGKHITKVEYALLTEGQGMELLFWFDQDVVDPSDEPMSPWWNVD